MGKIFEKAAGVPMSEIEFPGEYDKQRILWEVYDNALAKLDEQDAACIREIANILINDKRLKNFGIRSAHEVLVQIGILLAPDRRDTGI